MAAELKQKIENISGVVYEESKVSNAPEVQLDKLIKWNLTNKYTPEYLKLEAQVKYHKLAYGHFKHELDKLNERLERTFTAKIEKND